jgi:formate dehydrogenase subunit gamma
LFLAGYRIRLRGEPGGNERKEVDVSAQQPFDTDAVHAAIGECADMPGALLPVLHGIQERLGHIPAAAVPLVANALNLSRAEVHGVIAFYHHFRDRPAGRHIVEVCRAEACQARGAGNLEAHALARLGCKFHETTTDGGVTLEPVYCLGLCATGPSVAIDGKPHSRVSPERFDALLERET